MWGLGPGCLGFRAEGLGLWASDVGFRVGALGLGSRVWGL